MTIPTTPMSATAARSRLLQFVRSGALDLPDPGSGRTVDRWRRLFEISREEDVSVARLAEAHVDAVGILHEAGLEPVPDATYAVWASVGTGGSDVSLERSVLEGTKPFCSGVEIVDRALVEVSTPDGRRLAEIDTTRAATWTAVGTWGSPALAATATRGISFRSHPVERFVGPVGWYLSRPGFWQGACGPAACWAGGAAGLVTRQRAPDEPVRRARHGALLTETFLLESLLDRAGHSIDERPDDAARAQVVALATRSAVHDSCLRLTEQFSRLFGPRALLDPATAQRHADVLMYIRQFHADDDLVALSKAAEAAAATS